MKFIHLHLVADSPSTDAGVYNLHLITPFSFPPLGIQGETKPGKDRKDGGAPLVPGSWDLAI